MLSLCVILIIESTAQWAFALLDNHFATCVVRRPHAKVESHEQSRSFVGSSSHSRIVATSIWRLRRQMCFDSLLIYLLTRSSLEAIAKGNFAVHIILTHDCHCRIFGAILFFPWVSHQTGISVTLRFRISIQNVERLFWDNCASFCWSASSGPWLGRLVSTQNNMGNSNYAKEHS